MSHAGRRAKPRRGLWWRPVAAVTAGVLIVLAGTFFLGRTMGAAQSDQAREFTGEVTSLADDGRMLCVEPDDPEVPTPFCDLYYLAPGTDEVQVGDDVRVRTVVAHDEDGAAVSGMLVTPTAPD